MITQISDKAGMHVLEAPYPEFAGSGDQRSAGSAGEYMEIGTTGDLLSPEGANEADTSTTAHDADHIGAGGD